MQYTHRTTLSQAFLTTAPPSPSPSSTSLFQDPFYWYHMLGGGYVSASYLVAN